MPGWGNVAGFIFDMFGSKAERRRNKIEALEKEQDELRKQYPATARSTKRLQFISDELGKLYKQAKNG